MSTTHSENWGGARQGAGAPRRVTKVKIADLQALAASMQALLNIAEVKAPFLCDDPQWVGLKAHLEKSARALGVEEWSQKIGEKYRQKIENQDMDESYG